MKLQQQKLQETAQRSKMSSTRIPDQHAHASAQESEAALQQNLAMQDQSSERQRNFNGNRFFISSDEPERPKGGRVYAAIEVLEDEVEGTSKNGEPTSHSEPVILECIDTDWFGSMQWSDRPASWLDIYREAPLTALELTSYPLPPYPEGAQPGDIAWYEFGYESASPAVSDARVYSNLFSAGTTVKIAFHEQRALGWQGEGPMGKGGWLTAVLASQARTVNDLESFRSSLRSIDRCAGVAIYDVGQGSCQAVLDSELNIPLLYIDFGGGVLQNAATFPKEFRGFCFSEEPLIVLSHWDWDHWSSAYRHGKEALAMNWVARPAPEKPIQQAFAAELFSRGVLKTWDSTWPSTLKEGVTRFEVCTGRTTNDSGIAATIYPSTKGRRSCLLPGDASYRYVPAVLAGEAFNSLCLTHHGGALHSNYYPSPRRSASAANSAGPRNSYRHPSFETICAHLESGWSLPLPTAFSGHRPCHVFLPWGKSPRLFQGGCHGETCSVAIADMAPRCETVTALASTVKGGEMASEIHGP